MCTNPDTLGPRLHHPPPCCLGELGNKELDVELLYNQPHPLLFPIVGT